MGGKKVHFGSHRDCFMIDPSELKPGKNIQRPGEIEIDEEMVQSILEHGVVTPLSVSKDGLTLIVEQGHRRLAHALEANKRLAKSGGEAIKIPCVFTKGDETSLLEKAIIENYHREQPGAVGTALAMQKLIDLGRDEKRVALMFKFKSTNSVKGYLKLLDCSAAVQKAVELGKVPANVAIELVDLPKAEQADRLDKMIAAGATKGSRAKKAAKTGDTTKGPKAKTKAFVERFVEALKEETSARAELVRRVISFLQGHDRALNEYSDLQVAALAAKGQKAAPKKVRKHTRGDGLPGFDL